MKGLNQKMRPFSPGRHSLWSRLAPPCYAPGCPHDGQYWPFMQAAKRKILLQGLRYCLDPCLEAALRELLGEACQAPVRAAIRHRVPIGLLLVSRQQLTNGQLRAALATQQEAGHGRIGEWLQRLGYASEEQITAALARQWSCPVLRMEPMGPRSRRVPPIPLALMRWTAMVPVDFVEPSQTLHIAFAEGLDYSVLYAIGQMLGCRTEPCLLRPSLLQRYFEQLPEPRGQNEILFERLTDNAEFARIVVSYALRVSAEEIRIAACGRHIWVRLIRPSRNPLDLMVREVRRWSPPPEQSLPVLAAV
jgi:Type II secretion system (T2SS), protein E, N-terminal domain